MIPCHAKLEVPNITGVAVTIVQIIFHAVQTIKDSDNQPGARNPA
jgi:hypothetical protein